MTPSFYSSRTLLAVATRDCRLTPTACKEGAVHQQYVLSLACRQRFQPLACLRAALRNGVRNTDRFIKQL